MLFATFKAAYRSWCGRCDTILSKCGKDVDVTNIFAQENESGGLEIVSQLGNTSNGNLRPVEPSETQRRACNYLQVLKLAPKSLTTVLTSHRYEMPHALLEKLRTSHDIQSIVRRSISSRLPKPRATRVCARAPETRPYASTAFRFMPSASSIPRLAS